jgi:dolichol-phosphate mannosyltransferase
VQKFFQQESKLFMCFALVGLLGYGWNLLIYALLIIASCPYLLAAIIAFVLANLHNYLLNRIFTFKIGPSAPFVQWVKEWGQFLIVGVSALVFNLLLLASLVEIFSIQAFYAQAIAVIAVTPLNYLGNRLWTFKR